MKKDDTILTLDFERVIRPDRVALIKRDEFIRGLSDAIITEHKDGSVTIVIDTLDLDDKNI